MPRMLRHTAPLLLLLGACDPGHDTLTVRIYGEAFIESGIPAGVFDDGWTLHYDRFLVSVGKVDVGETGAGPALSEPGFQIFDLTQPSMGAGSLVAEAIVPTGRYDDTAYFIAPAADARAGNASADDVTMMRSGGYSVYVAGSASKDGVTKRFAWGFGAVTDYVACESLAAVNPGEPGEVQITIHGDHLFYDELYDPEALLLFDLVASADVDEDGEITQAELLAVDLRPLPNYQVGSTDIEDLWHFIEHQSTTIGHIDGEGFCKAVRLS